MDPVISTLLPVLFIIPLGFILKKLGLFHHKDTELLNKIIINLLLPAVILGAFWQLKLRKDLLLLPLTGLIIIFSLFFVSILIAKILKLPRQVSAAFTIIFASMEGGLIAYPLFLLLHGQEGLATIALWDISNTLIVFTLLYFWACRHGKQQGKLSYSIKKLLTCPIPIAMVCGIILSIFNLESIFLQNLVSSLGKATPPIIMLTLGIAMEPSFKGFKLPLFTIISKTIIGGLIGYSVIHIFGFTGLWKLATIVAATLPAPVVVYIFAAEQELDEKFVANYLSIALPIGVIVASILMVI